MSRRPDHALASTMTADNDPPSAGTARAKFSPRRLVPLIVIAVAAGVVIAMGWQRQLSFETLARHYEALRAFIAAHEEFADRALGDEEDANGSDRRPHHRRRAAETGAEQNSAGHREINADRDR